MASDAGGGSCRGLSTAYPKRPSPSRPSVKVTQRAAPTSRKQSMKNPGSGQAKARTTQSVRAQATAARRKPKAKDTGGAKARTAASNRAQIKQPKGKVGTTRKGRSFEQRTSSSNSRSGASRVASQTKKSGLQNYGVKADNPGGAIGAAFRSFFDIGEFLKGR